jgi:hypothetical protein
MSTVAAAIPTTINMLEYDVDIASGEYVVILKFKAVVRIEMYSLAPYHTTVNYKRYSHKLRSKEACDAYIVSALLEIEKLYVSARIVSIDITHRD